MLRNFRNFRNLFSFRGVGNNYPPSKGVTFRYSPGKGCRVSRPPKKKVKTKGKCGWYGG